MFMLNENICEQCICVYSDFNAILAGLISFAFFSPFHHLVYKSIFYRGINEKFHVSTEN